MAKKTVSITGMGVVTAHGVGCSTFASALLAGASNYQTVNLPPLPFPVVYSPIDHFSFSQSLALESEQRKSFEKICRGAPRALQVSVIAALEACLQAHLFEKPFTDPSRLGIIVAGQNTSCHYSYSLHESFQKDPEFLSPTYALNFMDTNYVGVLSELFGIHGEGFTVGGSLATGTIGLIKAMQLIQDDRLDACLVVGVMADLSPMELQGFRNIGALGGMNFEKEPHKACRPFDKAHEGFIYGQGTGAIFLESSKSAAKRGTPLLGSLLGGSIALDGNRLSNPSLKGETEIMRAALKNANVERVDYINTHGTSAPLGDETELEAISQLLGSKCLEVPINSTKSLTGHCLWSAGIVEAIATVIQIQKEFVHPTLNLENPISDKVFLPANKSIPHKIETALSNSFGFGGFNASIVISSAHHDCRIEV